MWYSKLSNRRLWQAFNEISRIPRESGNEEGIRNYLLSWAEKHSLEAKADSKGNVVIYAKATKGCEKLPAIALQGHMDMVCVKRPNSKHDFLIDPIAIETDGVTIRAKDTSLGADNGIAIAMILSILSDPKAQHGPVEAIFTVEEETGLGGVYALDTELVKARRLINLDSEEEGLIYTGCAGGLDLEATLKYKTEAATGTALKVKVSGLLGGHSGSEIHKERGNAIKILARYLNRLPSFSLASIDGGTRHNVIPSTAEAVITVEDKDVALSLAAAMQEELVNEYKVSDPGVKLSVSSTQMPSVTMKRKKSQKLADLLFASPHGVAAMSTVIDGVVETSDNLAMVRLANGKANVSYSIRSNVDSRKMLLAYEIITIAESLSFKVKATGNYPAWEPNPASKLTKEVARGYKKITGKKPVITAIHAGLECGILNERIPGMDSVSIGPELHDVHSVNENLNVESAERICDFLTKLLPTLR